MDYGLVREEKSEAYIRDQEMTRLRKGRKRSNPQPDGPRGNSKSTRNCCQKRWWERKRARLAIKEKRERDQDISEEKDAMVRTEIKKKGASLLT